MGFTCLSDVIVIGERREIIVEYEDTFVKGSRLNREHQSGILVLLLFLLTFPLLLIPPGASGLRVVVNWNEVPLDESVLAPVHGRDT